MHSCWLVPCSDSQFSRHSHPLNVIFGLLLDKVDALQHVSDVIKSPLLDVEDLSRLVQVQDSVGRLAKKIHKLLGQQAQWGVIACLLSRRLRSWSDGLMGENVTNVRLPLLVYSEGVEMWTWEPQSISLLGLLSSGTTAPCLARPPPRPPPRPLGFLAPSMGYVWSDSSNANLLFTYEGEKMYVLTTLFPLKICFRVCNGHLETIAYWDKTR